MSKIGINVQKYVLKHSLNKTLNRPLKGAIRPKLSVNLFLQYSQTYNHLKRTGKNYITSSKPQNNYSILNKSFYISQRAWYKKTLNIVGQSLSEFAFDLKPIDSLYPEEQFNQIEMIKVESKLRRKKPIKISKTNKNKRHLVNNFKILGPTISWRSIIHERVIKVIKKKIKLSHFRKIGYKFFKPNHKKTRYIPYKPRKLQFRRKKKSILQSNTKFKYRISAIAEHKNKARINNKHIFHKKQELNSFMGLTKTFKRKSYKDKYVNSSSYQHRNNSPGSRHSRPYLFCNQPKYRTEENFEQNDYVSVLISNILENRKSNTIKRILLSIVTKLKKNKRVKYFPHFSKKYKILYTLKRVRKQPFRIQKIKKQWLLLQSNSRPLGTIKFRGNKIRYAKNPKSIFKIIKLTQRHSYKMSKLYQKPITKITKENWFKRRRFKKKINHTRMWLNYYLSKAKNFRLRYWFRGKQWAHRLGKQSPKTLKTYKLTNLTCIKVGKLKKSKKRSIKVRCLNYKTFKILKLNISRTFNTRVLRRKRLRCSGWGWVKTSFKKLLRHRGFKSVICTNRRRKVKFNTFIDFRNVISNPNTFSLYKQLVINKCMALNKSPNVSNEVFKKISYVQLFTRINQPFIINSTLMFFSKIIYPNRRQPFKHKYVFKKKLFSFLQPNEVRNELLKKKKQFIFYKLIFNKNKKKPNSNFYSARKLKKLFSNHNLKLLSNKQYDFFHSPLLTQHTRVSNNSSVMNAQNFSHLTREISEVTDQESFKLRGDNNSFKLSEVKIPRIRFKPGYQRLWRKARTALKESLHVKFLYQQKLSKYIVRFFRQTNYYTYSRSEMELQKTVIYSRLLPDIPTVGVFLNQCLIYLNGASVTDPKTTVLQNDIIQFIVSQWYYIAYRWIANWTLKRHKKFKRLVYRKGLASKHKVMKLKKQRSYYTPHWIYLARYDISDIKPYLEVDYLTLSACVIYNPYLLYYFAPDDTPDWRSTIYRLYNWKYIT